MAENIFLVLPSCSTLNLPAHPNGLTCLQGWHPSLTDQFSEPSKLLEDQPQTLVAASQNLPAIIYKTEQSTQIEHLTLQNTLTLLAIHVRPKKAHGNILSFYLPVSVFFCDLNWNVYWIRDFQSATYSKVVWMNNISKTWWWQQKHSTFRL